ncbi:MAG: hypothetical protein LBK60_09330 [Verrucomicrobiales bacterium]|jgi:hypothetical protein|nr:hypothetical protein [Verrucomicrobiales bacterium]
MSDNDAKVPPDCAVNQPLKMPLWLKILVGCGVLLMIMLGTLFVLVLGKYNSIPARCGGIISSILLPTLLAWGACKLGKVFRAPLAGGIGVLVLFGFFGLNLVAQIAVADRVERRRAEGKAVMDVVQRISEADAKDVKSFEKLHKESIDVWMSMSENEEGEARLIARTLLEVMTPLSEEAFRLMKERNDFFGHDNWILDKAKSKEDLRKNLEQLKQLSARNGKLLEAFEGLEQKQTAAFEKNDFSPKTKQEILDAVKKYNAMRNPAIIEKLKIDGEICATAARMLSMLDERWGEWSDVDGTMMWEKQEDLDAFLKDATLFDELIEKQERKGREVHELQVREMKKAFGS